MKKMVMFQNTKIIIKPLYLISLCLYSILLVGCSQLGVGQAEYSCRGMPNGVKCLSASEVYALTESHDVSMNELTTDGNFELLTNNRSQVVNSEITSKFFDGNTTFTDALRTEAKIMRILIRPWVDSEGDIHLGEYILTEIEPAGWVIKQGR